MQKINKEDKAAFILIIIAAILRLHNYADWSLSNDELSAMARLQFPSFAEMIEKGVRTNDMHPMGVQSFLWIWTHLTGISVGAFRLPFVILGIGSVIIFYRIASLWFNKTAGIFAVCFFSILQFPILYSQLARPYSPGLFFSLLFVLAWTKLLFENKSVSIFAKEKRRWYLIFIISAVACMYVHYFSFMFAGIVAITGIFYLKKEDYKWYVIAGALIFLLYIPNFNIFLYQFSIGGLGGDGGWLGPPEKDALLTYIYYGLNNSPLVLAIALLFFCWVYTYLQKENKMDRFSYVLRFVFF